MEDIVIIQDSTQITVSIHELSKIVSITRIDGEPGGRFASSDTIGIHSSNLNELIQALQKMKNHITKASQKPYERWHFNLDTFEVVQTKDGYYRYLSHEHRILTEGFGTPTALVKYKDCYRFDTTNIDSIRNRYENYINESK